MTHRIYAFACSRALLIASIAVLGFAPGGESYAKDNKQFAGKKCTCVCELEGGGSALHTYNAVAHCFMYNRRTCNVEVKTDAGYVLKSGKTAACVRDKHEEAVSQDEVTTNEPGAPQGRPRPAPRPDPTAPAKPRP
jgi:hypothetical protein